MLVFWHWSALIKSSLKKPTMKTNKYSTKLVIFCPYYPPQTISLFITHKTLHTRICCFISVIDYYIILTLNVMPFQIILLEYTLPISRNLRNPLELLLRWYFIHKSMYIHVAKFIQLKAIGILFTDEDTAYWHATYTKLWPDVRKGSSLPPLPTRFYKLMVL